MRQAEADGGRGPGALALGLAAVVLLAAFSEGATGVPASSRVEIAVALLAACALALVVWDERVRAAAPRAAWAAVALLGAYAAWCALSIEWSPAPDESWLEANRALAYSLAAATALVVGSSLRRAPERAASGLAAVALLIAVWALAGKALPGVFQHTEDFSRLRAPLGYWNALGLVCAMGAVAALWRASVARRPALGAWCLSLLLVTLGLTYSRGGILALVVGLALLVGAAGAGRARLAGFALVGALAAAPALAVGFARDDLTTDGLAASAKADDGLIFIAALVLGAVVARLGARAVIARESSLSLPVPRPRHVLAGLTLALVLAVGALALTDRGVGGTIEHQWDSFRAIKYERQNDPGRVLRANSGNRWVWWREAAGAWWDAPVEGHGAGSFPLLHLRHRRDTLEVRQPHSVPLEWLAENGLVGLVLAGGAIVLLLAAGVRALRRAHGADRAARAALLGAGGAWVVHLPLDWDWDIPALTLPALACLAVLAAAPLPPRPPRTAPGVRVAVTVAGALAACLVALSALLPALARERTSEALAAAADGSPQALERGAGSAEAARRLDPLSVRPLFAAATLAERRGRYAQAAEFLAEAARRQPENPAVWVRLSRFELLLDDVRAALRSARRVAELDPRSPFPSIAVRFAEAAARSASATGTPLPAAAPAPVPGVPGGQSPEPPRPQPQQQGGQSPEPPRPQPQQQGGQSPRQQGEEPPLQGIN